jgi:hypothetical protein
MTTVEDIIEPNLDFESCLELTVANLLVEEHDRCQNVSEHYVGAVDIVSRMNF